MSPALTCKHKEGGKGSEEGMGSFQENVLSFQLYKETYCLSSHFSVSKTTESHIGLRSIVKTVNGRTAIQVYFTGLTISVPHPKQVWCVWLHCLVSWQTPSGCVFNIFKSTSVQSVEKVIWTLKWISTPWYEKKKTCFFYRNGTVLYTIVFLVSTYTKHSKLQSS